MAITKNSDGTYTVDFYQTNPYTLKKVRVRKKGFRTKKEANDYIYRKSESVFTSKIVFEELLDMYLQSRESSTVTKQLQLRSCQLYFPFINRSFNDISKADLILFRNQVAELPLSTITKNRILNIVCNVFKFGSSLYDCPDRAKNLQRFKTKFEEHKEMEIWSPEEFNHFITHVNNYVFKAFYILLYNTGMRRGEARALLKTDITDNIISINKSMRRGEDSLNFPKTQSSIRKIKLDEYTLKVLKPLLELPGKYLFGEDAPLSNNSIQHHFTKAINASGVKKIRIHDLRHSHASFLINSGANIVAVSKRLGHSDINQTLKTYTHLLEKTDDELLEILNNSHLKK